MSSKMKREMERERTYTAAGLIWPESNHIKSIGFQIKSSGANSGQSRINKRRQRTQGSVVSSSSIFPISAISASNKTDQVTRSSICTRLMISGVSKIRLPYNRLDQIVDINYHFIELDLKEKDQRRFHSFLPFGVFSLWGLCSSGNTATRQLINVFHIVAVPKSSKVLAG